MYQLKPTLAIASLPKLSAMTENKTPHFAWNRLQKRGKLKFWFHDLILQQKINSLRGNHSPVCLNQFS
jgi:hypothetical protein